MSRLKTEWRRSGLPPTNDPLSGTGTLAEFLKHWRQRLGYCSLFAAFPAILAGGTQDALAENGPVPEAKGPERQAGLPGKRAKKGIKPPFLRQAKDYRLPYQIGKMNIFPSLLPGGNDDCPGEVVPTGTYTAASPFVDNGDTTGANNTIDQLYYYYYWGYSWYYDAHGPDRVYSFNVYNFGTNPQIQVTTNSETYRPMIYLAPEEWGCPAGTGNILWGFIAAHDSRWEAGNTATIPIPTGYGSRNYQLFVDSSVADDGGAYTLRIQGVEVGPNRAPDAVNDTFTAYQDSAWDIPVLSNDTDPDRNLLSVTSVSQGTHGSVTINGWYVRYTPNAGFVGTDTFTYTASDGYGGSDTATVTVTVNPNAPPVANDDAANLHSGWNLIDVLSNDSDPDGNQLFVSSVTQAGNGTVNSNYNSVVYTPNVGFSGVDTFTYTANDGRGGVDTATVTVTVAPNQAPTANDDAVLVKQDSGSNLIDLLGNDSDPDTNGLTISSFTQGSNGTVETHPYDPRYVYYRPNAGFSGVDTFTYTITDGQGGSDTATVTVTVGTNFALAANGGTATASSTYSSSFPASGANNGDRKGTGWGSGGGWNDGTLNANPDWLEINFNGVKSISQVDVFTVQDNYQNPGEPDLGWTFSRYGITAFDVQYWNGSDWVTVPGGGITNNNKVWTKLSFTAIETTGIRVRVNAAMAGYSRIAEVEAWGLAVAQPAGPVNVALAANGGVASASSTYSGSFPVSSINNGDRQGLNWGSGGGWNDATLNSQPDSVEISFNGPKTINEIDVFTLQDNYQNPVRPSDSMTFAQFGITAFDVQYWDGANWVTVQGGSITGNNRVWRKLTFPAVETTKIRVVVNGVTNGYSRIVEVEAWSTTDPPATPTPTPTPPDPDERRNVALGTNGGTASASSTHSSSFPAGAANNGDRKGTGWGSGGGWNDGTLSSYPDWLQIDFNGTKTIDEIDVFTLQDNYQSPAEPSEGMTFSQYGITAFDVQYWDGAAWVTVPGGNITNNNKVWTKLTFSPVQTARIRVLVNNSLLIYSRIVEVEAYGN